MALPDRATAIGSYAQQLLDNKDVQAAARHALDATRSAYQRARGQDARKAVQDRKLRRRVTTAVAAVGELFGAVSEAPPTQKTRWPKRIAVLAAAAGGAWLISNDDVRARLRQPSRGGRPNDTMDPSTDDAPKPS